MTETATAATHFTAARASSSVGKMYFHTWKTTDTATQLILPRRFAEVFMAIRDYHSNESYVYLLQVRFHSVWRIREVVSPCATCSHCSVLTSLGFFINSGTLRPSSNFGFSM